MAEHETSYNNIQDTKTGIVEGIFTSAKKNNGISSVAFDKVSDKKFDGSFTPVLDPKTKKPILDKDGNISPNPNKGGQYIATFVHPRKIAKDAEPLYEVDTKAQAYVDKHEAEIEKILDKNRKAYGPQLPKQIGGQDDET